MNRRLVVAIVAFALLYTGGGFLPGRVFAPLDVLRDFNAWKSNTAQRVRVSNSLISDVAVQFAPWDGEVRRMIAHGAWPWTNRFAADDAPLFANPQVALLSPFTWPRLVFGIHGWALTALLKLVVAALSMSWLARKLGATESEAAISGVVYAGSAAFITTLLFPHTNVLAWVPAMIAAAFEILDSGSRRAVAALIATSALATAGGHPESLFIGVLAAALFLVSSPLREGGRRPREGGGSAGSRKLMLIAAAALTGFAILAVQMLPFALILRASYETTARAASTGGPFSWTTLPAMILPGYAGSPVRGDLDLTAALPQPFNFNHRALAFIGFTFLIAIVAVARQLTPRMRRGLWIAAAALVISLQPPLLRAIIGHIPVMNWAAPEYFAYIYVLFASAAAGPALMRFASAPRRRAAIALGAFAAVVAIGAAIVTLPAATPFLLRAGQRGIDLLRQRHFLGQPAAVYQARLASYVEAMRFTAAHRYLLPALCWLAAAAGMWRGDKRVLATAAIAELLVFGIGFNPSIHRDEIAPDPAVIAAIHQLDPRNEYFTASHFENFPANAGTTFGIREAVSYDVLTSRERVAQLQLAGYDPLLHTLPRVPTLDQTHQLERLGVRWYIATQPVPGATRVWLAPDNAAALYELPNPVLPRPPQNRPPRGLTAGLAVTAAALVAAWLLLLQPR